MANGNSIQTVLFVWIVWVMVVTLCLTVFYFRRKKHLNRLLNLTEQLEERYLIAEIMAKPKNAEEQVFWQIMKMAEKSMLEKIGEIQRDRKEYREYIEQWIHEVKTPITAMKLLCENNRSEFTRDLLAELENINRFTEQALYYARSEHTEKDYSVRETRLSDVVHGAIADNKYLLRKCRHSQLCISLPPRKTTRSFCLWKTTESASHKATFPAFLKKVLRVRMGGPSKVPPGSVCIFAGGSATSWGSDCLFLPKEKEQPSPFPFTPTILLPGCRADTLCTSYVFVRTV